MNMYYFGNSLEYIEAEYALSNRSTCKGCKQKINKDQLRLGLILDDDHFNARNWYHLKCFQLKPRHLEIQQDKIEEKIYNIDRMEQKDFNDIIEHIKNELHRLKDKKKGSKKDTKKQTKKSTKKASKKGSKGKKRDQSSEEESFSQPSQSQSEMSESSSSSESPEPQKKSRAKKSKKSAVKRQCPYSQSQLKQFDELYQKFNAMTAENLKQILGKNRQAKVGNKSELAERCADGKLLGAIPTCSACGGGRLRFDRQTGIYKCPGFMEDTDFVHCNKKYEFSEIKRDEWTD